MKIFAATEYMHRLLGMYSSEKRAKGFALQVHRDRGVPTEVWQSDLNSGEIILVGTFSQNKWRRES